MNGEGQRLGGGGRRRRFYKVEKGFFMLAPSQTPNWHQATLKLGVYGGPDDC